MLALDPVLALNRKRAKNGGGVYDHDLGTEEVELYSINL
jgi:hypothetical protein